MRIRGLSGKIELNLAMHQPGSWTPVFSLNFLKEGNRTFIENYLINEMNGVIPW